MRVPRFAACITLALAALLAAPAASAIAPGDVMVGMEVTIIFQVDDCESGPYDSGRAPDAGWDSDVPGVYFVIPDPRNLPDGRTGFVIGVCVDP